MMSYLHKAGFSAEQVSCENQRGTGKEGGGAPRAPNFSERVCPIGVTWSGPKYSLSDPNALVSGTGDRGVFAWARKNGGGGSFCDTKGAVN